MLMYMSPPPFRCGTEIGTFIKSSVVPAEASIHVNNILPEYQRAVPCSNCVKRCSIVLAKSRIALFVHLIVPTCTTLANSVTVQVAEVSADLA